MIQRAFTHDDEGDLLIEEEASESQIEFMLDEFKKQKRAASKAIINANVIILDEFASTGNTLNASKKFFVKLGCKNVYTAALYYHEKSGTFDIMGVRRDHPAPWWDEPVMLKDEPDFKTGRYFNPVPVEMYDIFKDKAQALKKHLLDALKKYADERQ